MTRGLRFVVAATIAASLVALSAPPAASGQGFAINVTRISPELKERMKGKSWHRGCPVPIRDLRLIRVSYHGFDREPHMGKLVVNEDAVRVMSEALRVMWDRSFKIRRMRLVDVYDGSDDRSMSADNTSAFNCRRVAGTDRWSEHAYGRAIDINPVENPYVSSDGSVSPPEGRDYADRSQHRRGMIRAGSQIVKAFTSRGWGWGGNWDSPKDYQHFSASGN